MAAIAFNNVTKIYENNVIGLNNITINIQKGEFVFILGKSGAGKSTFLNLITRQIEPTSGKITVEDVNISEIPKKKVPFFRRNFGIVYQEASLLPNKNVYDNIAFAMIATEKPTSLIKKSVPIALGTVGMRKKADCYPWELSGGELFRVGLARAIVNNPSIIIADEPTANLDPDMSWDIMCLLDEFNRKGVTVLVATHAKELVNIMRKRVVTFYNGRMIGDVKNGKYGYII